MLDFSHFIFTNPSCRFSVISFRRGFYFEPVGRIPWVGPRLRRKSILFHLLDDNFLIFAAGRIEAVFVQQHLAKLGPASPCLLRDVVVDLLSERTVEWGLVQTAEVPSSV